VHFKIKFTVPSLQTIIVFEIFFLRGEDNKKTITDAYNKLLINQFHDILPGSHIHPVYEGSFYIIAVAVKPFVIKLSCTK